MSMQVDGTRALLSDGDAMEGAARGLNLHAIAPILIGLATPVIVFSLTSPSFLAHARFLILSLLCGLFVAATVMFMLSLLMQGSLSAITIDQNARAIELVYSSTFANKGRQIPFADIATLKLSTQYDDDGYRFTAPELILRDGSRMLLPITATEVELRAARQMMGLA